MNSKYEDKYIENKYLSKMEEDNSPFKKQIMKSKNKNIVIFGGSGGLGRQLTPLLEKDYNVLSLSSKDVDITKYAEVFQFFSTSEVDIVINLSGYNY